jgi:hypothetical protein
MKTGCHGIKYDRSSDTLNGIIWDNMGEYIGYMGKSHMTWDKWDDMGSLNKLILFFYFPKIHVFINTYICCIPASVPLETNVSPGQTEMLWLLNSKGCIIRLAPWPVTSFCKWLLTSSANSNQPPTFY